MTKRARWGLLAAAVGVLLLGAFLNSKPTWKTMLADAPSTGLQEYVILVYDTPTPYPILVASPYEIGPPRGFQPYIKTPSGASVKQLTLIDTSGGGVSRLDRKSDQPYGYLGKLYRQAHGDRSETISNGSYQGYVEEWPENQLPPSSRGTTIRTPTTAAEAQSVSFAVLRNGDPIFIEGQFPAGNRKAQAELATVAAAIFKSIRVADPDVRRLANQWDGVFDGVPYKKADIEKAKSIIRKLEAKGRYGRIPLLNLTPYPGYPTVDHLRLPAQVRALTADSANYACVVETLEDIVAYGETPEPIKEIARKRIREIKGR